MTQQKIKEILERFKLLYNQYLNECDVYDGANFYGNEKVQQCITDLTNLLDNWISVKTPPKITDDYLICTERDYITSSHYSVADGMFEKSTYYPITHWQPLPQPPKE